MKKISGKTIIIAILLVILVVAIQPIVMLVSPGPQEYLNQMGFGMMDLFVTQITSSFMIASFTSLLSTRSITVFWKDAMQELFVYPKHGNLMVITVYCVALVTANIVMYLLNWGISFIVGFILNIGCLGYIVAKMLTVYFDIDKIKNRLYDHYVGEEKRGNITECQHNIELLQEKVLKEIDEKEYSDAANNAAFLLKIGEIDKYLELIPRDETNAIAFARFVRTWREKIIQMETYIEKGEKGLPEFHLLGDEDKIIIDNWRKIEDEKSLQKWADVQLKEYSKKYLPDINYDDWKEYFEVEINPSLASPIKERIVSLIELAMERDFLIDKFNKYGYDDEYLSSEVFESSVIKLFESILKPLKPKVSKNKETGELKPEYVRASEEFSALLLTISDVVYSNSKKVSKNYDLTRFAKDNYSVRAGYEWMYGNVDRSLERKNFAGELWPLSDDEEIELTYCGGQLSRFEVFDYGVFYEEIITCVPNQLGRCLQLLDHIIGGQDSYEFMQDVINKKENIEGDWVRLKSLEKNKQPVFVYSDDGPAKKA